MELYQAYTDYEGMMELDRVHVPLSCRKSLRKYKDQLQWHRDRPWQPFTRMTMNDAIKNIPEST